MQLDKLSRHDRIIGGLGLLLIVSLIFFPWFSYDLGPITVSSSATSAPDAWLGIIALLGAIGVVGDLGIERFSPQTQLPAFSGGRTTTRFILAGIAGACVVLKFLFHIHFNYFGWGFYVTVVAAAALAYTTLLASGGSVSLPKRPRL